MPYNCAIGLIELLPGQVIKEHGDGSAARKHLGGMIYYLRGVVIQTTAQKFGGDIAY